MAKGPSAQEQVVALLLAAGFIADGETPRETFRGESPTSRIYGGIGGRLVTTGGRARYALPGTNVKATVGPRSTAVYRVINGAATAFECFRTKDVEAIRTYVEQGSYIPYRDKEQL